MENLYINENPDLVYFPIVNFNYTTGICEITGESYMEETYKFYQPILNWLENYLLEKKSIEFNFKLSYFNTSSSRSILEIFSIIKKHLDTGGKAIVNWYYDVQDPDMVSEIKGFEEESGVPVKIIPLDQKARS
jgi:hypothetical protein